jgi:ubiquinone/menaquinone biosynthesis C-methylase UbiE
MINRLTTFFLGLLYTNFAWGYDLIASIVSIGHWNNWVRTIIPLIIGPNVLELGHGPGHLQRSLAANNFSVYGIDKSGQMSRITKKRLAIFKTGNKCVSGLAQQLPFINNHFNTIVATFPTEYIYDPETLFEIKRVLCPDGLLVILLAVWISEHSLAGASLANVYRLTGQAPDKNLDEDGYTSPLESIGFKVEIQYHDFNGDTLLVLLAKKINSTG